MTATSRDPKFFCSKETTPLCEKPGLVTRAMAEASVSRASSLIAPGWKTTFTGLKWLQGLIVILSSHAVGSGGRLQVKPRHQ